MVWGGKTSSKTNADKTVRSKDKYSDDSDEDYVISDEENEGSGEDYCSSLEVEASDEEFDRFNDDEEEVELRNGRQVAKSEAKKDSSGKKSEGIKSKTRRVSSDDEYKQNEDSDDEDDYEEEKEVEASDEEFDKFKDDEEEVELCNGRQVARSEAKKDSSGQKTEGIKSKTRRVSSDDDYKQNGDSDDEDDYEEEEEMNDDDDNDNDDVEEFTLDEEYSFDEVKESIVVRKKKMGIPSLWKKGTNAGCKRRRKLSAANTCSRKRVKKNSRLGRKIKQQSNDDLLDKSRVLSVKSKKVSGQRKRRSIVNSDSDFEPSGSSDYEYTISEEEREQIREAEELCGNLVSSLRSSSLPKEILEEKPIRKQRKPLVRKGKEKVEVKVEVGKQLCGICLSEEDKRRVRGTLECCTHYFCFTCIMEWAKVESRCPLCKQRFKTISKPARSAAGVDLREVVVQVPERDQVYQPSEEELMSYLDPYEHVLCTECHEGGDDGLMLLCDLCDSPAHTYCVGLGGEVPEGNWYCDGCKHVAMGSGLHGQGRFSNRRTAANNLNNGPSPAINICEGLDLNSIASPRMPFGQGFGDLPSPVSGAGAPTLSGRRWIHRHIQQLLSSSRTAPFNSRTDVIATNPSGDLLNSLTNQGRETTLQESRPQVMATTYNVFFEERLNLNPPPPVQRGDFFSSGSSHLRRQTFQNLPTSASANSSVNGASPMLRHGAQHLTTLPADRLINDMIWSELMQINSVSGFNELQPCNNRLNVGAEGRSNLHMMKDETDFHTATDQLQSMIQIHLKDLSRNIDSGHISFKAVEQSAINTILAVCGIENSGSDVYQVAPPSICLHIELTAGGQTTSLIKGCCSACFNSFVGDVVKKILDTSLSQWLSLGL